MSVTSRTLTTSLDSLTRDRRIRAFGDQSSSSFATRRISARRLSSRSNSSCPTCSAMASTTTGAPFNGFSSLPCSIRGCRTGRMAISSMISGSRELHALHPSRISPWPCNRPHLPRRRLSHVQGVPSTRALNSRTTCDCAKCMPSLTGRARSHFASRWVSAPVWFRISAGCSRRRSPLPAPRQRRRR